MKRKILNTIIKIVIGGVLVFAYEVNGNVKIVNPKAEEITHRENISLGADRVNISRKRTTNTSPNIKPKQIIKDNNKNKKEAHTSATIINEHNYHKFYLSFYTSLPEENTKEGTGTDDRGKPLVYGDVADNYLPYGTEIHLKGIGNVVVRDVGSPVYFTNEYKLDVFIPKEYGESDSDYYKRVNAMGRKIVEGYIVNEK